MNFGSVLGAALGGAAATTLIAFPIVALAIQGQRKAKLGWVKGLLYFAISVALTTVANFIIYLLSPESLTSSGQSGLDYLRLFGVPLLASAVVLLLLWRPLRPSTPPA